MDKLSTFPDAENDNENDDKDDDEDKDEDESRRRRNIEEPNSTKNFWLTFNHFVIDRCLNSATRGKEL